MKTKVSNALFFIAALVSLLVLVIAAKNRFGDLVRNSDFLWTIALFEDLRSDGSIRDWNLSNHTDFFPDKIIAWLIWNLSEFNYDIFLTLYAAVSFLFWIVTARVIFGSYRSGLLSSFFILALCALGLISISLATPFQPSLHFTATCLAFICTLQSLKKETGKLYVMICLLTLFGVFLSDRLVVIYSIAFAASTLLVSTVRRERTTKALIILALIFLTSGSAYLLHDGFWTLLTNISKIPGHSLSEILSLHLKTNRFWLVLTAMITTCLVAWKYKAISRVRTEPAFITTAIILLTCLISTVGVMLKATLETRYIAPSVFLCVGLLSQQLISRRLNWANLICAAAPIFAVTGFMLSKPTTGLIRMTQASPVRQCIDELAKMEKLQNGVGTYWNTHEVNLIGAQEHFVRAIQPNLKPYYWVTSRRFFEEKFNFLIESDRDYSIDLAETKKVLGEPFKRVFLCEEARTKIYVLTPEQSEKLQLHLKF